MNNIQYVLVPLEKIVHNRYQQAGVKDEAAVMEIVSSLKQNENNGTKGLLQVPTARALENGTYELAFGHHRFYAFDYLATVKGDLFFNAMPLNVQDLTDLQMFELMGIENLQRRGIGPVEEANIFNAYMTNFHKTSVEAAKKFGKSEEYVRGSIRLLNLPESALSMVQNGTLNKSAARDLLVAEKLGGAELVQEVLDEIAEAREEEEGETPSDVVYQALRMTNKTAYLEPQEGWYSVKKFPAKHLTKLTKKEIDDLIDFDMTNFMDQRIDDIVKDILVLISAGMEITDEAFPMITPESLSRVRILANPPQCDKCPLHAVVEGTHFCGLPCCKERKVEAWSLKEKEDEIKNIGIQQYQKSDGEFFELNPYNDGDNKLFKDRNADLRLLPSKYVWNNFPGISQNWKIVIIGEEAEKRLKKEEAEGKKEEKQRDIEKKERENKKIKREFLTRFEWEVVSLAFESMLDGFNNYAFLYFLRADCIDCATDLPEGVDEDKLIADAEKSKKSDGLKTMRRIAMFHIVEQAHCRMSNFADVLNAKKSIVKYAEDFQKIAANWGVSLPKDFAKQAEAYQAELDAAIKAL